MENSFKKANPKRIIFEKRKTLKYSRMNDACFSIGSGILGKKTIWWGDVTMPRSRLCGKYWMVH